MKKGELVILCLLLLVIFISADVYAVCNENQRILRLSSESNAHGEVYNGAGNYPIEICYNEIFGKNYTEADPHLCGVVEENKVLGLSASTNAHAQIPTLTNYTSNVCYGDLICRSATTCDTGESCVVTLSSSTNAHLATCNSLNNYSIKICCKSPGGILPPEEGTLNLYWANLNGDYITQKKVVPDYTKVLMVLENSGITPRTEVDFEIYEVDPLFPDLIRTLKGTVDSYGDANVIWTITQADLDATGETNFDEFYFKVNGNESNLLEIIVLYYLDCGGGSINLCSDYTTYGQDVCIDDPCTIAEYSAENSADIICGEGYLCYCDWNLDSCNTTWTGVELPIDSSSCNHGETLCYNSLTNTPYCIIGNKCPDGDEPQNDGDWICEVGEGCLSSDCIDGDSDTCVIGASCLSGVCVDEDNGRCLNGETLCYNDELSIFYCIIGNKCPAGDEPQNNGINGCEVGEGCLSADCKDGDLDSCVNGAKCLSGVCVENDALCANGEILCYNTNFKISFCFKGTNCPTGSIAGGDGDGICEFGESCASTSDCSDGDLDTCINGASCLDGKCYKKTSFFEIGKCTYSDTSKDNCTDGFLDYSWGSLWTWNSNNSLHYDPENKTSKCISGGRRLECPAQVKLPFFGIFNLISALMIITGIYGLLIRRLR
ncbi:MAG: hypothetical protein KKF67_03235 [Nanoarchaeota archaeon]|nr:hypothetical protein [Nanoarchaeota archaeon]